MMLDNVRMEIMELDIFPNVAVSTTLSTYPGPWHPPPPTWVHTASVGAPELPVAWVPVSHPSQELSDVESDDEIPAW